MSRKSVHSVFFSTVNCLRLLPSCRSLFSKAGHSNTQILSIAMLLCFLLSCFDVNAQTIDSLSTNTDSLRLTADSLAIGKDSLLVDSLQLGDDFKSKVKYSADDSIVYDIPGEKIFLYGNGVIDYEDIHLTANYIEINNEQRTLFARGVKDSTDTVRGKPIFKQGSEDFNAETITYNFKTKKGKISEISTQEGESFIHGETVKKMADNSTYIKHGYYTTCDAEHPHYYIAANKIKVIPNNKIVTGPANLVISDVPTFVLVPFGFFPNKTGRSSGIIFPAYGESNLGFFLQNGGYYFGMNDHIDAAITGDIFSLGSWKLNLLSNYSWRYRFGGSFAVSYAETVNSQKELPDYQVNKDFFIRWNHTVDPKANPNSTFSASVNAGSSTYFRNTLSNANNFLNNTFQSSISYSKFFPGKPYSYSVSLSDIQNVSTRDITLNLPSATFNINRITPFQRKYASGSLRWYEKIGVSTTSSIINTISTKDTLLFKEEAIKNFRTGIQHSIPINTSFMALKYLTVTPAVNLTERWYFKSFEKSYDAAADSVLIDTLEGFKAAHEYSASLSANTRIYGQLQFRKGKIAAIRHILTPNVSYSWRPDFGQSKYGYYKYVTSDSIGTQTQYSIFENSVYGTPGSGKSSLIGFSLDNNLEMKLRQVTDSAVNIKKVKLLESLSLSTAYNLAADSLQFSLVNLAARSTIVDNINVAATMSFDPYATNEKEQRINQYYLKTDGNLLRLVSSGLSVNWNLRGKKTDYQSSKGTKQELNSINKNPDDYIDFSIPFNLAVGYSINYTNGAYTADNTIQTLSFNGDITLTPKWKITFYSGYDFIQNQLSYTTLGFYRDLHCWEMRLNWTPMGQQANYNFQINVKSSILQDLKLVKRKDPEYFN